MTTSATLLGEAELHGLVDGHLEVDRRADVLRKLAASPADRALVEAWQEQNDLIRAAFRDVERESLPVALDLAPPRLRCIDGGGDGATSVSIAPVGAPPLCAPMMREPPATRRGGALATVAAMLVVAAGLAGSWLMIDQGREDGTSPPPQASLETTLGDRTAAALGAGSSASAAATSLPAIRIPDLSSAGLRLTSVSTQGGEPASIELRYRDAGDAQIVLGIAGAPDATASPLATVGKTLVWRHAGIAYALAGTLPADRLRALARSLPHDAGNE